MFLWITKKAGLKEWLKRIRIKHWRIISMYLVIYDVLAVNIAFLVALWLRFDCSFGLLYLSTFLRFAPIYTVLCVGIFAGLRLYNSIWRFASYNVFSRVAVASAITGLIHIAGTSVVCGVFYKD